METTPLLATRVLGEYRAVYLRRNRTAKGYEYWTLVRSVPMAQGPRQEVVANLGKLPGLETDERLGWEEVDRELVARFGAQPSELGVAERWWARQWGRT